MNSEYCPCCPNHCTEDHLNCGRGKEYFNRQNDYNIEPKTFQEQVIMDLKKCGHLLHHNKNWNADELLSNFSEEELHELHDLLSKFCGNE